MNKVCVFVHDIDEDIFVKSKEGNTDHLLNDLVYLLRVEENDRAHYIYMKTIVYLFNLGEHCIDVDHRSCPACSKQVYLKSYNSHISICYEYSKNSTLLKLSEAGKDN